MRHGSGCVKTQASRAAASAALRIPLQETRSQTKQFLSNLWVLFFHIRVRFSRYPLIRGDQSSVQIKQSHAIVIGSLWKTMSASSADAMAACLNLSLVVSVSGATCRGRCWINPPTGVPLPFQVIADVLRSRRDETVGDFPYPYSLGNTVSPHLQPQFRRYPPLRGGRVRSLRSTLLHWSYRQIAMER